jgi:hydroxymethylpyrimidine/phosphomethylpyrimidine kinase
VECSCCSRDRETVALKSHDDIRLCRECIDWLASKVGVTSTPTLPVVDMADSIEFYERAGFGVRLYREDEDDPGEGFAFVEYDGVSVFDLDFIAIDPDRNGAGCYLVVQEADEWHARMNAEGLPVTSIEDQPWGMREYTLTDPSGNRIRIGRAVD